MSISNCCFLTCMQISQETGQVVWYSHLLKNFPVYCDPHIKGFSIVNKTETDIFLELFLMIQWMLAIWFLIPLPFLNPPLTSGSSQFTYSWGLAWRILSITLLTCEMSTVVHYFEHSLSLPFWRIGIKTKLMQPCDHCCAFQICWHIECNTLTASSFKIWNSWTEISSPPLALFVVRLPNIHLT